MTAAECDAVVEPWREAGVFCDGADLPEVQSADHHPLGAVLEHAPEGQDPPEFASIVVELCPADGPRPHLDSLDRKKVVLGQVCRSTSDAGRRCRISIDHEPLHPKVVRPANWVKRGHPDLVVRADMASLAFDESAGESELALSRAADGSRAQVRKALDGLEMTGCVRRQRSKAGSSIELVSFAGVPGSGIGP